MGKKLGTSLIVIGVILVALAIVWWAVLAPMLVKLPSDVDTDMKFEGNLTVYMDPDTGAAVPAGQEMAIPITADRNFASLPDLYTSGTAVFEDTLVITMMGEDSSQVHRYALDRKTRKCVESTENWSYDPAITLDRTGNYGPLFPGGLKVGDTVTAFFNDPAKAFDVTVAEKIDDWNGLGITVLKLDATRPSSPYYPAIAAAVLGMGQELPMEVTFEELAAQLKAMGLDLKALLSAVASVASPEDLQALGALQQQPVKLVYSQESGDVIYIEQKTGATVGATFDRTTTYSIDPAVLTAAVPLLTKYATDPTVGPMLQTAMQGLTALGSAEPAKVYNQNMSIIATGDGSQEALAASAKDKVPMIDLAKLWIPLIIVCVGALLLIVGGIGLAVKSKKAAA